MLTQHDNDSDIMASLAAGASGYCLKDVEPERLLYSNTVPSMPEMRGSMLP